MKTFLTFPRIAAFALVLPELAAATPNWPSWRGPLFNGVAPDAQPPVTWSESTNVGWKVSVPGRGSSTRS